MIFWAQPMPPTPSPRWVQTVHMDEQRNPTVPAKKLPNDPREALAAIRASLVGCEALSMPEARAILSRISVEAADVARRDLARKLNGDCA